MMYSVYCKVLDICTYIRTVQQWKDQNYILYIYIYIYIFTIVSLLIKAGQHLNSDIWPLLLPDRSLQCVIRLIRAASACCTLRKLEFQFYSLLKKKFYTSEIFQFQCLRSETLKCSEKIFVQCSKSEQRKQGASSD